MINTCRFTTPNTAFRNLVKQLDQGLAISDGADHSFYHQFNGIEDIKNIVIAYENDIPVGCGAFKVIDEQTVEIKRMFVPLAHRGKGIATKIINELATWSKELSYKKMVLETGAKQVEALIVYPKYGFKIIPNYGQYVGVKNSICFGMPLI